MDARRVRRCVSARKPKRALELNPSPCAESTNLRLAFTSRSTMLRTNILADARCRLSNNLPPGKETSYKAGIAG